MQKAVFLDRDGIINKDRADYTFRINDFIFVDDIFESLKKLKNKNYLLIVISNQAGIARKVYSMSDAERVHAYMQEAMKQRGIEIDEIYYCPHHDSDGRCLCRKPDSLLIEKALARFAIDASRSFFIGDRQRDMDAAAKAGVSGILVASDSTILSIADMLP